VCANIERIIALAAKGDVHGMVYAMKEFVPEYKSQQSRFEAIDKEIESESMGGGKASLPLQPKAE